MLQTPLASSLLARGGLEQTFPSGGLCSAGPTQSGLVMCYTAHQSNSFGKQANKTNPAILSLFSLAAHFHEMVETYYF